MDLTSAVQSLLSYEASLKLAPGQKPPPPSPSLFDQLTLAVDVTWKVLGSLDPPLEFSNLPPSVWSDWPLCCGMDLTPEELQAARSLSPTLLRERGLLSLFLALNSCAEVGVDGAAGLAPNVIMALTRLYNSKAPDQAPFPSAHLAARVGHRLINADGTLDFMADSCDKDQFTIWKELIHVPVGILIRSSSAGPNPAMPAVPHEAAALSLAKELAMMLDALCAGGGLSNASNRLPFHFVLKLLCWAHEVLILNHPVPRLEELYKEAVGLPTYNPVLLLQSFYRSIDSGLGLGSLSSEDWSVYLEDCRFLLWTPLTYRASLSKIRPANAHTAMSLGLEDLGRQELVEDSWPAGFFSFTLHALQSGLVQPELILRARPQLLEGLVDGLARGRIRGAKSPMMGVLVVSLLAQSPAVSFYLRKYFSRSGCLHFVREIFDPRDSRKHLIRLLGPRAAQSDAKRDVEWSYFLKYVEDARRCLRDTAADMAPSYPVVICDLVTRDFTLDILREPSCPQPFLQYLSELAEEIAAPKRPHAQYGVSMVVGLEKACLAFSTLVARALKDIREAGLKGKGVKGSGGPGATGVDASQKRRLWLVAMARELSSLRRRVLRELLPLAEAREAALWVGVREEEVAAALITTEGA